MATLENVVSVEYLISLRETRKKIPQYHIEGKPTEVEVIDRIGPALLGYDHVSRIAPHRAYRPLNRSKPEFTRAQVKDLHSRLSYELPVECLDTTLDVNLEWWRKKELANCPFCPQNIATKTPEPRFYHEGLETNLGERVISVPNISSAMGEHLVTVFGDHFIDLSQLTYRDMVNIFLSGYQIARDYKNHGAVGIHDFINFGKSAGGTKEHPHSQRGEIRDIDSFYRESEKARIFRDLNGEGGKLMYQLITYIRQSPLAIFENDHIFIYAAWAPRYPHHIEVIFKNPNGPNAGNYLDFNRNDLEIAARSMLGIFHALRGLEVTELNFALHQSSFIGEQKSEPKDFRMQAEIIPTSGYVQGALEKKKLYIIPTIPEITAAAIRDHYNQQISKH